MLKIKEHLKSFTTAWQTIISQPFEHLINVIVLALIITLCASSLAVNNNLNLWQHKNIMYPQIMLYFENNAQNLDVNNVEKTLNKLIPSQIHDYKFISKEQGLADLQKDQQLKEVASGVVDSSNNPLPDMLIINTATADDSVLQHLNLQLEQLPKVNQVQMDLGYAGKVRDLLNFINQAGMFSLILFIVTLSLVVYNMVRLQMLLKSDAIVVSRLMGASDSFIMRPLIHYAVWQITLATTIAAVTLHFSTINLNHLFADFSNLFGTGFQLAQLPLLQFVVMWLILVVFTIFTVFMAVRWVFKNTTTH